MRQSPILLYGHGGYGNRGCEAIVRSTAALLHAELPDAPVWLCSLRPEEDSAVTLADIARVVPHHIAPYSIDRFLNAAASRLGASRDAQIARTQAPVLRAAHAAGMCLSIGGDTYCYGRPEMLYAINRRLQGRVPLVLWGCSVEPELLTGEMLDDLRRYTVLFARETITYAAMRDAGLPVYLSADPAFTLAREDTQLPEGFVPGDTVGLNISPLALRSAPNPDAAFAAVEALVHHILRTTQSAVALVPHVRWPHDDDMEPLGRLAAAFAEEPRVLLLDAALTAPQLKGCIARMRCFIGARTHATIAAYSTAVPTLVLGYSIKARGIARDLFGTEEGYLLPVQELASAAQLTAAFDALRAGEDAQRAHLRAILPAYAARAREAIRTLITLTEEHA